ncbi:hypothetical protein FXV91_02855 [Methanosarcina sp. DH2]|uniref:hypothetical protein n=1 Tax=Methanosarcina sp. DH2 TaxID=2605639 RepID=UPI001E29850D|nr:hypothetical protein [Methanosarcina sp. DH2]MCC4769183.1 hypothetical protein [Methanosarcina sp. DH2]
MSEAKRTRTPEAQFGERSEKDAYSRGAIRGAKRKGRVLPRRNSGSEAKRTRTPEAQFGLENNHIRSP